MTQPEAVGCSDRDSLKASALAAGKTEVLAQYARDYPLPEGAGPHEQPQSM